MNSSLTQKILRFIRSEDGPTAVEYAIMLALVLLTVIGSVTTLGEESEAKFQYLADNMPGR